MVDDNILSTLLRSLYAATITPKLWDTFLENLISAANATSAVLIAHNLKDGEHSIIALSGAGLRESVQPYEQVYFQFDEWTLRFPLQATLRGTIVLGQEIWPDASFRNSAFYNEFLKRFDICQMACLADGHVPGVFDALSIFRGKGADIFERETLGILQFIAPHLRTALQLRKRLSSLEARTSELETALNGLSSALVLVDPLGRIVFANVAAERIFDRGGLMVRNCRLTAQNSHESTRLQELVRRATNGVPGPAAGCMSVCRPGKHPLHLLVSPFLPAKHSTCRNTAAAVLISDPEDTPAIPINALHDLFRLTGAEVRISLAILAGQTLNEIAETNHVSRETVKSQVRSIFQKTGTRRQSELISLLNTLCRFQQARIANS